MAGPLLAQFLGGGENSMLGNFMLAFVALIAMGYPDGGLPRKERARKPLSAIAWLDGWGKPWPGA